MEKRISNDKTKGQTSLNSRAMLVTLKISQWRGRKLDKKISSNIERVYQTEGHAGNYHKLLIDHESFKAIGKSVNKIRTYHYGHTLPWLDDGARILTAKAYWNYVEAMGTYKGNLTNAIDEFVNAYEHIVEGERKRLGRLFSQGDYPIAECIRNKFSFDIVFSPVPASGDFRCDIGDENIKEIQEQIQGRVQEAEKAAMKDIWGRLFSVIKSFEVKLKDNSVFRNSLVGNIYELCEILPTLNVSDDPALEDMRREVERSLANVDPDDLRNDDDLRRDKIKEAEDILKKMTGILG